MKRRNSDPESRGSHLSSNKRLLAGAIAALGVLGIVLASGWNPFSDLLLLVEDSSSPNRELKPNVEADTSHPGSVTVGALRAPAAGVECSAQEPPEFIQYERPGYKPPVYRELMAMPSDYNPTDPTYDASKFDVIAIITVYRRPMHFERMLFALANQTHPPKEIWITTWNSPHEEAFRTMTRRLDPERKLFKFIAGDPSYSYFGRFALGMMAPTTHVAFFDDDCIPGKFVFRNTLHIMYEKSGRFYGLIGMKGHRAAVEQKDTRMQEPIYHKHWEMRGEVMEEVDLTGGMWFLRTEWVRALWRERPITLETAEDMQLTAGLRKFMGLHTFLLANDWGNSDTWASSKDVAQIAGGTESTNQRRLDYRAHYLFDMFNRGYEMKLSEQVYGEAHGRPNLVFVLDSVEHTKQLLPVWKALSDAHGDKLRLFPVINIDPRAGIQRGDLLPILDFKFDITERKVTLFDVNLMQQGKLRWTSTNVVAETVPGMSGILRIIRPALVVTTFDPTASTALAAVAVMQTLRIPFVSYAQPSNCSASARGFCEPAPVQTFASDNAHFVTNSHATLYQRVLDVLCGCERADSKSVGAYAVCIK